MDNVLSLSKLDENRFRQCRYVVATGVVPNETRLALLDFYERNADSVTVSFRWPVTQHPKSTTSYDELRCLGPTCIRHGLFAYVYNRLDLIQFVDDSNLTQLLSYFTSKATLEYIREVSGKHVNCIKLVGITDYAPGDFLGPHKDATHEGDAKKVLAFNFCLESSQGEPMDQGCLVYCPNEKRSAIVIPPVQGSLTLFDVDEMGIHYVSPITTSATRRISLVGFFCFQEGIC